MTIVRRILPVLLAAVLLSACGETKDVLPEIEQEVKQEVETVLEEVEPTPEPTQTPEEAKTMASTASNATKDAPQVTDPSTWNDAGKTIMEALEKQYAPYGMTLQAKEGTPYFLAVNRDANVVTVYTADEDGRYTVLVHKHGESRVRKSLNLLFQELNSPEFLYIEKGYIVNIRHVMSMKNHILHMRDGAMLPVGIPRVGEVKRKIAEYWRC